MPSLYKQNIPFALLTRANLIIEILVYLNDKKLDHPKNCNQRWGGANKSTHHIKGRGQSLIFNYQ